MLTSDKSGLGFAYTADDLRVDFLESRASLYLSACQADCAVTPAISADPA